MKAFRSLKDFNGVMGNMALDKKGQMLANSSVSFVEFQKAGLELIFFAD